MQAAGGPGQGPFLRVLFGGEGGVVQTRSLHPGAACKTWQFLFSISMCPYSRNVNTHELLVPQLF